MSAVFLIIINTVDEVTGRCLEGYELQSKSCSLQHEKAHFAQFDYRLIHYILRHKVIRCLTLIQLMQT